MCFQEKTFSIGDMDQLVKQSTNNDAKKLSMALCRTLSLRGVRSKTLLILQKSCKHNKKCLLKKNTDKREHTNLCEELTLMTHTAFICSNYSHEKKSKIRIVWWQLCYFVVGWVGFGGFLH